MRLACEAADGEDYYDLKKTLPRFYRLFEHLNKGSLVLKNVGHVGHYGFRKLGKSM